jgi:hypothetical protein
MPIIFRKMGLFISISAIALTILRNSSSYCFANEDAPAIAFDCGANSLYIVAKISGKDVSFDRALELAPRRSTGNTLGEIKSGAEHLGFNVEAVRLSAREILGCRVPVVVLLLPQNDPTLPKLRSTIGHYIVVRPVASGRVQILDYPDAPFIMGGQELYNWLAGAGKNDPTFPVLVCGEKGQSIDDMLGNAIDLPSPIVQANKDFVAKEMPDSEHSKITLHDGMNRSIVASFDFGDVPEAAVVTHIFKIENKTSQAISILRMEGSCTCTKLDADSMNMPSGSSITVTMATSLAGRFSNVRVDGAVYFKADTGLPPVLLVMTGSAHGRFISIPPRLDLGIFDPKGGAITQKFVIRHSQFSDNSEVTRVICRADNLSASLHTISANEASNEISKRDSILDVTFDAKKGSFVGPIELYTDNSNKPALTLEITAQIAGIVTITPERILIIGNPAKPSVAKLLFAQRDHRKLRLVKYEVNVADPHGINAKDAITASPAGSDKDGELAVNVTVDEKHQTQHYSGSIVMQLSIDGEAGSYNCDIPFFYSPAQ